ncbi:S8 family peptidase [Leptospira santarosai]|uniref:S8 family peptidase n=1 Tax=Leptospira santarosai TaxID=28183 RepID=UPI0002489D80|nr:S8 family peptidase [Leptospira santarosai]EMM77406.1 peptidase, S8/S53 family [Leptospira santarosai str. 2000030832]
MANERLLIKVIAAGQGRPQPIPGGGSSKEFKEISTEFRSQRLSELKEIKELFNRNTSSLKIIPMRVNLEKNAVAKSHLPDSVLKDDTTPIIGVGLLGELITKVTPSGLEKLEKIIGNEQNSDAIRNELSAIVNFEPISENSKLNGLSSQAIFEKSPKRKDRRVIKIITFDYQSDIENNLIMVELEELLKKNQLEYSKYIDRKGCKVYKAECNSSAQIDLLSSSIAIKSIRPMPVLKSVKRTFKSSGSFQDLPIPESGTEASFPIVAVVDGGIQNDLEPLSKWITNKDRYVAPSFENLKHGTFVAGLITWADEFNMMPEIGSFPCRVLDVQLLPNNDPSHGPTEDIMEDAFIEGLSDSLEKHGKNVKVWNLSLGTNELCREEGFSELALALDDLQDKYEVLFVISAGNFEEIPSLNYPRTEEDLKKGKITTPADSANALTVGAISHSEHRTDNGSNKGEPSSFSRTGPGPNYIIKPELVHFGGDCSVDGLSRWGIKSISDKGEIVEDIGTSFSAPLVSRTVATLYHNLNPTPSRNLAKAIIVHNARDIRNNNRVTDRESDVLGFGVPVKIEKALECNSSSITLVFEETLMPGYTLQWDDFPFPESLTKDGKYFGHISMTLVYSPYRNPSYGVEYCETFVDPSFGVFRKDRTGQLKYSGQVPMEHTGADALFENEQIQSRRKWAPVRTFHRAISNGLSGERWRLSVRLYCRHNIESSMNEFRQPFTLILTIADPNKKANVYDEMVRQLSSRYAITDIPVANRVRNTTRINIR